MGPRILFVVSGAYGDLTQAVSFLFGQKFSSETAVALPPKLYRLNRSSLPIQTYRFSSAKDIIRATVEWKARIVFFLSGYGLPLERVMSPSEVRPFMEYLHKQNCRVVTSDPFLGSASKISVSDILGMLPLPDGIVSSFFFLHLARRITRKLHQASNSLRDVVHLYPAPTDEITNRDRVQRISFFNRELSRRNPAWESVDHRSKITASGKPTEKTWLFMLAPSDATIQERKWGATTFANQLAHIMEQTRAAGRRPVLLGPSWMIKKIKRLLPATTDPDLLTFCAFTEFTRWLLNAEYAFSWNIFSCSAAFMRLPRRLPVIYFDKGHVAQFSKLIYEDGVRCYFGGWEPSQIDQREFNKAVVDKVASEQGPALDALLEYWNRSPTPQQVIDRLLDGTAG
jgi:hypothetical protein